MRHLSTKSLIGLAEGRLSPRSKRYVEQHLEDCALCSAEAAEWCSLLDLMKIKALKTAPDQAVRNCSTIYEISKPISKLQQLFATVLFNSETAAAPVGVRGVAECQQIVFRAGDVDIHLRIGGEPRVILGQITRRAGNHYLGGVPVVLLQGDQPIETTISDTLGEFRFGIVPYGPLRLHADLPFSRLVGEFSVAEGEIN